LLRGKKKKKQKCSWSK